MTDGAGTPTGTPLSDPPLIEMISEDPVLRNTKLIAEAWDCDGLNQVGAFPHYGGRWGEWNGHFRDTVRQFIKVCSWMCGVAILNLCAITGLCAHFPHAAFTHYHPFTGYRRQLDQPVCLGHVRLARHLHEQHPPGDRLVGQQRRAQVEGQPRAAAQRQLHHRPRRLHAGRPGVVQREEKRRQWRGQQVCCAS